MEKFQPPYLGAAYYPEDWPEEQIPADIALMKEAKINLVRVGEFAWHRMEPREGAYDFKWLHNAVDQLSAAGIAVILCTPTCTPPAWLTSRFPETLLMDDRGVRAQHGARRHACPTSPVYRGYVEKIVTKLASEFADSGNVIGWQIDNEVYPHGRGCCCPLCAEKFRKRLRDKFGTIEALNRAWCLELWSQAYDRFDEIPVPRGDTNHHPSLLTEWMEFQSDSYADFIHFQAEILHRFVNTPIGTDMMPFGGLNYVKTNQKLDVLQFNHYNAPDELFKAAFWMDYIHTIKSRPFWNTETMTNWSGGTAASGYLGPGFCRVNSWLPYALGGEANLYWLWRAHKSGQELLHGSVVDSCGRPLHILQEVQEIADGISGAADFLTSTRPAKPVVALHYSCKSWWVFAFQQMIGGFDYTSVLQSHFYKPLLEGQYCPDVIDPSADLGGYALVFSPFLPVLSESGLDKRILAWVRNGGVWVAGPMTDIRDENFSKFTDSPFPALEKYGGAYCRYQIPYRGGFSSEFSDGAGFEGSFWHDMLEPVDSQPLARITEGEFRGFANIVCKNVGRGKIILLGTVPTPSSFSALVNRIAPSAGIKPVVKASAGVLAVKRSGGGKQGVIAVEYQNKPSFIHMLYRSVDRISGRHFESGRVEVGPYQVMVLEKSAE